MDCFSCPIEHVDYAVIPAYEPDERLVALSNALHDMACKLIVVDDGSSASCQPVWNALAEDTVVLHHSENRGKGAALKTAFRYLLDSGAPNGTVVTVDADGQHLPVDVRVVCDMAHLHPEAVVLGVRQFGPDTPARSQIGNRLTSALFRAASHQKLRDTQTGLRAFSIHMLPWLVDIAGERYEYEMNMLFACGRAHIPLVQTPVHTVYLDARNSTSHFCTVRDSVRIAKTFLKFSISSLTGFAADYLAFLILIRLTAALPYHVLISNVAARVLSAALNYQMNRMLVFEGRKKASETLLPYAALALGILVGNSILLMLFTNTLGIPAAAAKPLTEVLLFLISLSVQSLVIFRSKKGEGPHV